ncbi:hypothetical protein [Nocardioides sp. B-3]|uniref:hypothetical protein n=1 Tax=Nocardioides sp. B-3 TaxID=2895565 RepID=UPI002152D4D2|nr:hypothetical protein [Nocardioides sp. B-3]UUZ60531.1 hypothetical protein LP418_06575 [Nocardioides sp. B-3]
MRIHIESGGITGARDACRTANQISAMLCDSLASKLSGFSGMAGDDSTSAEFAASYDSGAHSAPETLTELTHAFIGLGRLPGLDRRQPPLGRGGFGVGQCVQPDLLRRRRLRPSRALTASEQPGRQPASAGRRGDLHPRPGRGLRVARRRRRPAARSRVDLAPYGRIGGQPRPLLRPRSHLPRTTGLPRDPARDRRARRAPWAHP